MYLDPPVGCHPSPRENPVEGSPDMVDTAALEKMDWLLDKT